MTLSNADRDQLSETIAAVAARCALEAGAYLHEHFGGAIDSVDKGGYFDIVTEHDRAAEAMIVQRIFAEHPDSAVVGEEGAAQGDGRATWYIDPLDGTSNYASGFPFYCVSIGVEVDGALIAGVVYDPERDELFQSTTRGAMLDGAPIRAATAASDSTALALVGYPYEGRPSELENEVLQAARGSFRAVRRTGSAALNLAYLAAGRAHVVSETIMKPWDVAAGFHLIEQAGGTIVRRPRHGEDHGIGGELLAARYVAHGPGFPLASSALVAILD